MFQSTQVISSPYTNDFSHMWADRYTLDAVKLLQIYTRSDLVRAASQEGRQQTVAKVKKWLTVSSELAELKTNQLFAGQANIVEFVEIKGLAKQIETIYTELLDLYQNQSAELAGNLFQGALTSYYMDRGYGQKQLRAADLHAFEKSTVEVKSLLSLFREQKFSCRDSRIMGFMSTHFHLVTASLKNHLSPVETALLEPYMRFLEEQACIPWERLCKAANRYDAYNPTVGLARNMLSQSQEISQQIYNHALTHFPYHQSHHGYLREAHIATSSIRDLTMFQVYIWLCILEGNSSSIEHELLPLCRMVYSSLSVDWELVEFGINRIVANILQCIDDNSVWTVQPGLERILFLFSQPR